jgi:hypothetical protein
VSGDLIAYASRTGTRRNLAALRSHDWRLLVSAKGVLRHEGFPYALDNGAWTAYQQGRPFDERAFVVALRQLGVGADWTVLPDIVMGGPASLDMSLRWMRTVLDESPRALLAVQDGMTVADVRCFLGARVGIFVGGSTAWKLATLAEWAQIGREIGCWVHVGRVNTARRIALCVQAGATSFDGTSASRFAKTIGPLDAARRQLALFAPRKGSPC